MSRVEPEALALHLEAALAVAPADAVAPLKSIDRAERNRAQLMLATYLAERLACFAFEYQDRECGGSDHPPLFGGDLGPLG